MVRVLALRRVPSPTSGVRRGALFLVTGAPVFPDPVSVVVVSLEALREVISRTAFARPDDRLGDAVLPFSGPASVSSGVSGKSSGWFTCSSCIISLTSRVATLTFGSLGGLCPCMPRFSHHREISRHSSEWLCISQAILCHTRGSQKPLAQAYPRSSRFRRVTKDDGHRTGRASRSSRCRRGRSRCWGANR